MLSPKTLKYLRLTHRYVSFICAGILFAVSYTHLTLPTILRV